MVDAIGVAVEHLQVDFDRHTDTEISGHDSFGYLTENHDAFSLELHSSKRIGLEGFGRHIGRRGCVVILGIGPHGSAPAQRRRLEFHRIAVRIGAGAAARREHIGPTGGALGADQGVGLGGGEPAINGRHTFGRSHLGQCSGAALIWAKAANWPVRCATMTRRPAFITETAAGEWGAASATFSSDRVFRYTLTRTWDPDGPVANFLMLNPSTADAFVLDPTNRRCVGFAERWGYGGLVTTNIFAFRSTDPKGLRTVADPVGPGNDEAIVDAARSADLVIAAWGNHGELRERGQFVRELLASSGVAVHQLRMTGAGHPGHPLYLPADAEPSVLSELLE